ncbi:MAG TPA: hypothetical protein VJR29_13945 [bacterium]|nr:hypothetical protein [bacterium]
MHESQGDAGSWINLLLSAVGLTETREWSDESDAAALWSSLSFAAIFGGSFAALSKLRQTRQMTLGPKLMASGGTAVLGTNWMNDRAYETLEGAPIDREFDHRPAPQNAEGQ